MSESTQPDPLVLNDVRVMRGDIRLCGPLTVSIDAGQIWQIAGPNGTGKTTLLMMLAGLLPIQSGAACWRKQPPADWPTLYIGHLAGLNAALTVQENLAFLAALGEGADCTSTELLHALAMTGLAGYEQVPVARLSSGQKRRVGLARLWLPHAAPLWLLDEPMTALDVQMIARLNQRLADHAATGGRVLLTSHQPVAVVSHVLDLALIRSHDADDTESTAEGWT